MDAREARLTQSNIQYADGLRLLRQPVLPLVSMLQFLFMFGTRTSVAEVIGELPEPIETAGALYDRPRDLLRRYGRSLARLETMKQGQYSQDVVVDEENNPLDPLTADFVLLQQEVLTAELERINSLLCGPCGCDLCCTGPDAGMAQEFFEIPLDQAELESFPLTRHDSPASRRHRADDEDELQLDGRPFYRLDEPVLVHWQNGWSLILPKGSDCPNLAPGTTRCLIYSGRPEVCRRPQIFPYMVEPFEGSGEAKAAYRLRRSLLAVTDCPYVSDLRDEIAAYAAACELHLVLKQNKL
ncbi:MAG TPA: YkgJ family cysteine cluster protein [Desulfobacteraceae bacterium]|nr:YkgJ family cysteine cluster protein [Desulfobacteraceae bacterium]